MDGKNTYLASRITIKSKPPKSLPKLSPVCNDPILRHKLTHRTNFINPFDSMIDNGKFNPILPPVLNKHRKTPSIPTSRSTNSLASDRIISNSLNIQRSEASLPKIFKQSMTKIFKSKGAIYRYLTVGEITKEQNMGTPCFSNEKSERSSVKLAENQAVTKEKIEELGKLPVKCIERFGEVSFGDDNVPIEVATTARRRIISK